MRMPTLTIIFVVLAALSDFLDGYLARKLKQESSLGKIADPLIDKIFSGASLLGLVIFGYLPWLIFWLFLARDALMILASGVLLIQKKNLVMETQIGKISTALFFLGLIFAVANLPYSLVLFYACFAFYVASGMLFSIRIFQSQQTDPMKNRAKELLTDIKNTVTVSANSKEENAQGKAGHS